MSSCSESKLNYGYLFSGLISLHWLYKELTSNQVSKDISFIRSQLEHPNVPPKEGDIVHLTGNLLNTGSQVVKDELFGISVPGLKLQRKVEMLQWSKSQDSQNYLQKWSELHIDSKDFEEGFANPKFRIFEFENIAKGDLVVDQIKVHPKILKLIKTWQEVRGNYGGKGFNQVCSEDKVYLSAEDVKDDKFGIGSYRVLHRVIPSFINVSLIGQYRSGMISDYKGILLFREGTASISKLIEEYQEVNHNGLKFNRIFSVIGIAAGILYGKSISNK